MNMTDKGLEELLEAAVIQNGAKSHLRELEGIEESRRMDLKRNGKKSLRQVLVKYISFSVAACFVVMICVGAALGIISRNVGYSYNPDEWQRGTSVITALLDDRHISEALDEITIARDKLKESFVSPPSEDPEYLLQLDAERQELDMFEAVCFLRKGRYFKARRLLKSIAAEDGIYADDAGALLDRI